jgi:hypothetical protein
VAETKARTSSTRSKPKTRKATKARKPSANGAQASARGRSTQATKSRSSTRKQPSQRKPASKNGASQVETARKAVESVESTAKQAGHTLGDAGRSVGRAARKARTPLLAGSAALAGAAGGLALGARAGHKTGKLTMPHRPRIKLDSRDLAKATKDVGEFGVQVGQLASELRRARENAKANGTKHRSPIEVVLQGLTSRGDNA